MVLLAHNMYLLTLVTGYFSDYRLCATEALIPNQQSCQVKSIICQTIFYNVILHVNICGHNF